MNRVSSKSSARGNQVSAAEKADLQHWSELAHRAATILLADTSIAELRCEWPTVQWTDCFGDVRTHRFDYYAFHHDGTETAYNVKHWHDREEVKALFDGLGTGLGFRLAWVHEGLATTGRAANARCILKARQNDNNDDYVSALKSLVDVHGRVYVHRLLERAPNEADRREAVYSLIDRGVVEIVKPLERLADYSFVTVNHHVLAQELHRHVPTAA
ncbi:hypothetical protein [Rhizobium sp. Leaf383]|uniref:hypothetical protein n=1 Tax=Rhizobium sp. Leaf383 TaxID=1736357 RepID=UPI000714D137|nr:hypothetical protein [Rhizobium sp. Leaf383]KQS76436.1 hypothetical protein ASG58_11485 [Rhizobium sp. Leaf383]